MNLTIDFTDEQTRGITALVSRLNSADGAEQTTPEAYLQARVEEVLASYDAAEVERIKSENAAFFDLAAQLSAEKQEQLKAIVQQLAAS